MWIDRAQVKPTLIGVVVLGLTAAGMLVPTYWQRYELESRLAAARHELGMDVTESAGIGKLTREVLRLREISDGAQRHVPEEPELGGVLRTLHAALGRHAAGSAEVYTKPTEHYAHFSVIPIAVEFESTFPGLYKILERMEADRRLMRLERLEVEARPDGLHRPLRARMQVSTFYAQGRAEER